MNRFQSRYLRRRRRPTLTFAPIPWLKLQYFLHAGDTEVGGFAISAADNPLEVIDFVTLPQETTQISVAFRDEAVADYFDECVDRGLPPERFARIWIHTHPGRSVVPSATDEDTFERVFGPCDWAIMAILGRTGRTYARLRIATGPGVEVELPTRVDWSLWPLEFDPDQMPLDLQLADWQTEFAVNVHPAPVATSPFLGPPHDPRVAIGCPGTADRATDRNAYFTQGNHDHERSDRPRYPAT